MKPIDPNPPPPLDPGKKPSKSVKGLMLCRAIILTFLLTISYLFQISEKRSFFIPLENSFYYFIGFFYLITIVYAFLLNRVKDLRRFAFIQILADHLFIIGLVYFTGGKDSFFPITYIFAIIGSSIIFYKRGAYFSASFASLLYGLLLLFQYHGWIAPPGQLNDSFEITPIFYSLILSMATFYIVAFLSSTISEELKKKKSELIQKQDDYNQLEAFNRNIIQSLDSGLLTVDLEGRINFMNRTAERILTVNGEALKGVSVYSLFPEIRERVQNLQDKEPGLFSEYQRYETLFIDQNGQKVYLGFSISPLTGADASLMGHTLIFKDITRLKEMEEQMMRVDKLAAVGQLAAGMAHEIRNPLTSLSGSIQMLKSELVLDAPNQRLMEIILRESERLNSLITDFLLFAQPPKTNKALCNIRQIMDETIDLFLNSPEYHEAIQVTRPESPQNIQLMIDPDQMKQVLWNLLINAAQAMANGGEIQVHLETQENGLLPPHPPRSASRQTKTWVRILVSDSGQGIPAQEKEKIFDPFYTTKDGGTGLGLSIVHKIIESHRGLIRVESETERGATFAIYLPMDKDEETK